MPIDCYFRTDGRDVEGVDVPFRVTGPLGNLRFHTAAPGGSGEVEQTINITLVRHQAKLEPPLANLRGGTLTDTGASQLPNAAVLTLIAEVTIYGETVQGKGLKATGNVQVMRQAVEAAREAWGLATMCGVAGKGETLDIVPRLLITGRRVAGSSFGGVKGRSHVPRLVDRWLAGEFDAAALISHRISLEDVNHGFALMERQDGIRSVISFDRAGR